MPKVYSLLLIYLISTPVFSQSLSIPLEKLEGDIWVDPALENITGNTPIVVWFEDQLLGSGDSYQKRIREFRGIKRSELQRRVIYSLKRVSEQSIERVVIDLTGLERAGHISDFRRHWIVNGFSCTVNDKGLKAIKKLEGVSKIFRKRSAFSPSNQDVGPEYVTSPPKSSFDRAKVESYPWNIERIRAPEVWKEFGVTGKGTLNVIHDFGFKLDVPPLAENIYINFGEIPGNNEDDDRNGFIDDFHGFNFDSQNANLNEPRMRGTIIHGNACAAMVSGTFATGTNEVIGIAPESKWAPVIGSANIEQAVEWAIEQGADTYSMSFSQPNLGELRSHWRKVMEQASFCGIVFISGAGNFAAGNNFAPVPIQMRNPEDIPEAVLGIAGVGQDGNRPIFSSQGPVEWKTEHYSDGRVNKPDFATLNFQIRCIDLEGNLSNQSSGNSFAGPHMAGIISLMLSANPELLPWEVKEILKKTATDIGDKGFDFQSGYGFVNAYDAVKETYLWKK